MKKDIKKSLRSFISWLLTLAMVLETLQAPQLAMEVLASPGDSTEGVAYIDADGESRNTQTDGIEGNDTPAVLSGNETSLTAGWYVVEGEISINRALPIKEEDSGDYHIILADGAKLTIWNSSSAYGSRGIYATNASLFIYGQTEGSGELNIYTSANDGDAIFAGSITINGGKITAVASGSDGAGLKTYSGDISINDGEVNARSTFTGQANSECYGIKAGGKVIINGGQVSAYGTRGGVCTLADATDAVSLSWKDNSDYFFANSIYLHNPRASVTIASGKTFIDEDGNYYVVANASKIKDLRDTKLMPSSTQAYLVSFNCNGGTPEPDYQIVAEGETVTEPTGLTNGSLHFGGWYQDSECTNLYNFATPVTTDLHLYAKWVTKSTNLQDASIRTIYKHTGSNIIPMVWDNTGTLLAKDTDYTVSCKISGTETEATIKDPGFYDLTVTGTGSYTGSRTITVCVLTFGKYDPSTGRLDDMATLPDDTVNAKFVTNDTVLMNTGWYVVSGDVTVGSRMKVSGSVNLVLCDGATLNAGSTGKQGISVTLGNSLTIYSQAGNTGKLIAKTGEATHYAGIGADSPKDGTTRGAGSITIHGGEITAAGSVSSAAIGEAYSSGAGKITIYGGKITAIKNDSVKATGIGGTGADIHLSHCRADDFIYSGGYIGSVTFGKPFLLDGTSTFADSDNISGKKLVPVDSTESFAITFDSKGGTGIPGQQIPQGRPVAEPEKPIKQGYRFDGWYRNSDLSGAKYDFRSAENKVTDGFTLYAKWATVDPITYLGADRQAVSDHTAYSPMEESYSVLPAGSYFVDRDITLSKRVGVEGEVNLILGDGHTLTAEKGISVMGSASLSIFGQSAGTGALKAGALSDNAAIGGDALYGGNNEGSASGTIRIYGGDITAKGGYQAAGIGGGLDNVVTGPVYIYGGTIEAYGGQYGACIGGGMLHHNNNSSNGFIEISGGKVTVSANDYGTGIGGGNRSRGGTIRILGGQVTVSVSRNNYSGIGAGYAFPSEETHSSDHSNDVEADILLGCSKQNDFILSACYRGNNVWIADNQILQDGEGVKLSGAVTELSTISGNKLTLSHAHSFTYSRNGGTVTATCDDPACPFHVTPAIVSLSAPAGNLTYDGTTKAATLTDESGICGTESVLYQKRNSDDSWGEAAAEAPKNAGSYRAGITLADTGHGAVSVYVEYEIAQRPVTITDLTPPGRSYDGTTIADVIRPYATLTGKVEGDELDFVMGSSNFVDAAPGQNKSIICSGYYLSGAASANYILSSQPSDLKGTINQRAITIKAKDQTIELNGFIKNDLSEVEIEQGDSLVAGEELKSVTLTPYPEVADHVTNNGEYGTITPGSARIMRGDKDVTGYYRITYTQGNLTITRTRAKVLTEPTARTNLRYSGQESLQQLINPGTADTYMQYAVRYVSYGDGSPVEGVDGSTSPRDYSSGQDAYKAWKAGTYHVWYRAAADTDHEESVAKYVTVNIARVPLTIGLEPETITYGENPADSGRQHQYTYTGVVGGDSGSLGSGSVSFSECSWDVGSYPLRVYGFSSNNYDITFAPGILTIVPKEVSLDWSATPLTFNGRAQAPTVSAGSLSGNDAITVTVSGNRINAGSGYTATAVALTGDKAGNYRLPSDNTKTFSIAKAAAPAVTDISLELPAGTLSFNASAAGKMPPNAGTLSFNKGSESPIAYVTDWSVDSTTGLVSANISGGTAGDTITLPVTVSSENYENVEINVKVKLVDKSDAGIAITQGSALTTDYDINTSPTLQATVSYQGTGSATWSWESSDTSVATVASVVGNSTECTVTIKGAGTTCITAKYNSDTTAGSAVLNLTVRPGSVAIPEAVDSLSYNGSEQTGVAAGARYTVTGEKGTQPGSYTAVASLTDTLNYRWADGSAEPKYISWSIDKTAGPAAPEGLQAVPPTTGDNLDGKIRGVTADMEFASGISFNDAVPCFGNEIPGLIPGTWYVRIRETATRKPGEAAEVLIPKCTPPLVSAVQGLSYNGVPQILVTAGIPDEGSLYFAVTKSGAVEPAAGSYTTALPVKTDAGEYLVWYKIRSEAGETLPQNIRVDISKTYIDAACKTLSVNVCIGTEGMIEIDDKIPEQECRLSLVSSNESGVLDGKPTIIGRTIDYYTVNDPDKVGKNAWITVSVNDMVNYKNYDLLITLTAIQCDHVHTELRHVNGNKGDLCCADCNAVIQKGWSDPGGGGGGGGGETPPEEIYTVTVTDDGHGTGSASPASGKSGTEIRLSAYPAEAYVFKEWQLISGGVSIEGDAFILGEEDVVIRAVFEPEEGHIHNYTVEVTKEATCTEKGLKTYSCSCGDCYTEEIPALGHDYAEEITKEATTEEEGEICFTCRRCGHSYTEAIPKISDELLLYEKQNGTYELRLSKKLRSGESCILVPRFANGEVTNERVVWTSSDPDVAGVTQDGKLTAQRGGGTTITVRSEEKPDLTAYCVVTVTDPVTEISLDRKKVSLGTGESVTLSATVLPFVAEQELDWSANNEKVKIFVSEDGKSAVVTAAEEGNAKVTATARDGSGKKAVCSFTIGNPVPDFEIGGKGGAGEVKAGKSLTMQLNWKGPKPKNAELVWSVAAADGGDASCIAAISGKGVLSGIMAGKVTVTAVSVANPEKSASTVITVTAAEKKGAEITGISIANTDKFSEGLAAGKSLKCKTALTLSGSGKADKDAVAWYSSDSSIATVNRKGVVKAVAPGTVTITAIYRYAEDPETAPKDSLTFTVSASVKRVKADRKKLTLGTQEGSSCGKICIAAVLPVDATNPAIRWTANNKNVELAVVSAEGNASEGSFAAAGESLTTEAGYALAVRGLTPGVTKLTGVTVDGSKKKVSCTVTVRGRVTDLSLKTGNGKKGVNDVTDAGDGKYTSVMKAGGSMKLSPVLAINGVKNSGSTKKDYKKYKKYTDTTVSYRSSDTSVLTVDAKGKISVKKGVSGKTATVYVTSEDGKLKSEIVITVK